jgi:hypothetical protein
VTRAHWLYLFGVLCGALLGFFSPCWFLGFAALAAGSIWAAYDLVEVDAGGDAPTAPRG